MLLTAYNGAILGPIAKVLGWVMNGIYALMSMIGIENVGLSIIIFTIVIYAILQTAEVLQIITEDAA